MRLGILIVFVMLSLNLSITLVNNVPGLNPFSSFSSLPNVSNTYNDTIDLNSSMEDMASNSVLDFFTAPIIGFMKVVDVIKDILFGAPSLFFTIGTQFFPAGTETVSYVLGIIFILLDLIMIITLVEILTGREIIGL